jgi:hypothetical protein
MGFAAKIPFHTYLKYFEKEYYNELNYNDTHPIKINIRFVAIDDDFERICLKWYSSTLKTGGEFDEITYKNEISSKVHTWINWNSRTSFTHIDFL